MLAKIRILKGKLTKITTRIVHLEHDFLIIGPVLARIPKIEAQNGRINNQDRRTICPIWVLVAYRCREFA